MKTKLLIALILLTLAVSLFPNLHPEKWVGLRGYLWQLDIAIHASYYLILTIVLQVMLGNKISPLKLVGFIFAFSVLMEALQYLVPNRSVDGMDVASNALGISLGWIVYTLYLKNKKAIAE